MNNLQSVLSQLGIKAKNAAFSTGHKSAGSGSEYITSFSPIDGQKLAEVQLATLDDYEQAMAKAQKAFIPWRNMTAPARGEIVRQIGQKLREYKQPLGELVSIEMGKLLQEGLGEVQEMIDICDFAVGLSRQLHGFTMHSERPLHRMYDQYHPLGVVGIISAFNFPVAVWSWNAMLAAVCGNVCMWKPSEKTPLCAVACQHIIKDVLKENNLPEGVFSYIAGDAEIGKKMAVDGRVALVSATGSTRMGKDVAAKVGARLGKSILELGGNNAIIITPHANFDLAIRATVFGAVGTCGQRCTSTRRLIVHSSMYDKVKERLTKAYGSLSIGSPLEDGTLVGPLIDQKPSKL